MKDEEGRTKKIAHRKNTETASRLPHTGGQGEQNKEEEHNLNWAVIRTNETIYLLRSVAYRLQRYEQRNTHLVTM